MTFNYKCLAVLTKSHSMSSVAQTTNVGLEKNLCARREEKDEEEIRQQYDGICNAMQRLHK
jgi:superfamily I DNA/RNA helicase